MKFYTIRIQFSLLNQQSSSYVYIYHQIHKLLITFQLNKFLLQIDLQPNITFTLNPFHSTHYC